jgi:hypothetical protein
LCPLDAVIVPELQRSFVMATLERGCLGGRFRGRHVTAGSLLCVCSRDVTAITRLAWRCRFSACFLRQQGGRSARVSRDGHGAPRYPRQTTMEGSALLTRVRTLEFWSLPVVIDTLDLWAFSAIASFRSLIPPVFNSLVSRFDSSFIRSSRGMLMAASRSRSHCSRLLLIRITHKRSLRFVQRLSFPSFRGGN